MPARACTVEGCGRPHYGRGYCSAHWQRIRAGVSLDVPLQQTTRAACTVDGCDRRRKSRGLCAMHYERMRRDGTVDLVPKPPRERNPAPFVNGDGYRVVWAPGHPNAQASGQILEHRLVMAGVLGRPLLPDEIPHHKNGDRTDNDPGNLELCVRRQPPGQRVADLLPWAREIVERYDGMLFA